MAAPDSKFIATVESRKGVEIVCILGDLDIPKQIASLEEVKAFTDAWLKTFPEAVCRIYRLEEVKGDEPHRY